MMSDHSQITCIENSISSHRQRYGLFYYAANVKNKDLTPIAL